MSPPGVFAGDELAALVTDRNVTHAFLTPGVLSTLSPHRLGSLKVLVAGGEAVPADVVDRWAPGRRLYNGYGPTETAIMAAISTPLSSGSRVTIGGPIRGMDAVVLDTQLHPVPIGVTGELLPRRHRTRPRLPPPTRPDRPTLHRQPLRHHPAQRLYRTGDLARWRPDGTPRIPRPHRHPNQTPRPTHRTRRNRNHPHPPPRHPPRHRHHRTPRQPPHRRLPHRRHRPIDNARHHLAANLPTYMVPTTITPWPNYPSPPTARLDRPPSPTPSTPPPQHHPPHTPTEHTSPTSAPTYSASTTSAPPTTSSTSAATPSPPHRWPRGSARRWAWT